jgi:hypothetical protein
VAEARIAVNSAICSASSFGVGPCRFAAGSNAAATRGIDLPEDVAFDVLGVPEALVVAAVVPRRRGADVVAAALRRFALIEEQHPGPAGAMRQSTDQVGDLRLRATPAVPATNGDGRVGLQPQTFVDHRRIVVFDRIPVLDSSADCAAGTRPWRCASG